MPKSSMRDVTPMPAQPVEHVADAAAGSSMSALSVISSWSSCGGTSARASSARDRGGKVAVEQAARRDVDRDAEVERPGRASAPHCAQRRAEDAVGERLMSPGCSARGMKSSGPTRPGAGCCQRTSASTPVEPRRRAGRPWAGSRATSSPASIAAAQLAGEREPVGGVVVLLGGVDRDAPLRLLRAVHRHVGVAQQLVGVVAVLGEERDADAGADVERMPSTVNGASSAAHEPLGDRDAAAAPRAEQDRELVAAEAGQRVLGAERAAQAGGRRRCSRRSPAWWPSVSLTALKSSRSTIMQRHAARRRGARASALVERARRAARGSAAR